MYQFYLRHRRLNGLVRHCEGESLSKQCSLAAIINDTYCLSRIINWLNGSIVQLNPLTLCRMLFVTTPSTTFFICTDSGIKVHFHMSRAGSLHAQPSYTFLNGPSPSIKAVNASRLDFFRCGSECSPSVAGSAICAQVLTPVAKYAGNRADRSLLTCTGHLANDDATIRVPTFEKNV